MCLEIEDPSNTITLPLNTHIASSNLLQFANKISIEIVSSPIEQLVICNFGVLKDQRVLKKRYEVV